MTKLISSVQVDVGEFTYLHLPLPDGINNGGYIIPNCNESLFSYSPIDLLVAGIESYKLCENVYNLAHFFDKNKIMYADSLIYLTILSEYSLIVIESIAYWKKQILIRCQQNLLDVFLRNAPLTFKWVKI